MGKTSDSSRFFGVFPGNGKKDSGWGKAFFQKTREEKNADVLTRVTERTAPDMLFLLCFLLLAIFGLVMLYSASYPTSLVQESSSGKSFTSQLMYAGMGMLAAAGILVFADYYWLRGRLTQWIWLITQILLLAVFFFPKINGSHRWIRFGSISFQPSEVMKLCLILVIALVADCYKERINSFEPMFWCFAAAAVPMAIIVFEPHFSCIVILAGVFFVLMVLAGMRWPWILSLLGLALLAVAAVVVLALSGVEINVDMISHVIERTRDFLEGTFPDGEQTMEGLQALGAGGFWGLGFGASRQKYLFLTEAQNDYILAIVGEELGIVGVLLVLLLFTVLIIRGFSIAMHASDRFGFMVVMGITFKLMIQVLLNLAVVTNAMPVTGVPLPFFSMGGTALLVNYAEMALVLNISSRKTV